MFVMKRSRVLMNLVAKSTICSDEVSYMVSSMHWLMLFGQFDPTTKLEIQ